MMQIKHRYGLVGIFLVIFCLIPIGANAGYNANMSGEVSHVMTYPSGVVLFRLNN